MRKKWMSLLLVLCLIVGMLPLAASAAGQERSVSTRKDLESALQDSSVTKINLAANIDMGEDAWYPVVIDRDLIIDGQNHVISGLKVTDYALQSDGSGVAGTGSSCDYYSGFIGWNKKNLTINNLSFENSEVDINPLSKESTGSSILAVVVANNTGSLIYNDVTVTGSIVRGYTKVGILHGFTQGAGSFVANHCSIENSEVVLEADGKDPAAAFSGLIIGYDGNNRAKTNGIKLSGNTVLIDESVNWGNTPITSENGVTKAGSYGLTCDTYTHGSAGTNKVELVAQVGDYQYETLSDAITAASSEDTVTLLEDTDESESVTVRADKKVTLDLNGKTLNLGAQTMRVSGNLTVKDSTATAEPVVSADYETVSYEAGKIVYTGSGTAMIVQDGGSVTLLSGIVDASAAGTAIYANGNREPEGSENTQPVNTSVTISGGYVHSMEYGVGVAGRGAQVSVSAGVIAAEGNCAIGGNGTNSNERYDGDTTINITGGTIIGRMAQAFAQQGYIAVGIYHPQKGSMTISGGTIYADQGVGIAMRGGELNFTSGSVISTGTVSGKVGDSKVSMNCYGIQVDGGSGYYDYKNCAVTISGTASVSSQENVASVIVTPEGDQNKISISGGYFSYDPSEYLAAGMATLPSDKSGYTFMVGDAPQTEVEPATGDPSVNMNGIDPSDKETVEDAASSVDDNGFLAAAANNVLDKVTEQQIEDATTQYKESEIEGASEEDIVNIFAQTYLEITPTEYKEGDTPTLTMDITPMYRVVASTAENSKDIKVIGEVEQEELANAVVLEGSEKTLGIQIMTITVTLPEVFQDKKVFIQHVGYEYSAMADKNGEITFTNPHGFSEFTFSTTSKAVAQIGETSYTSFQDAINHVKNGETIILLQDKLSATVSQAVSFKVESQSGATYTANLTPGTNYTMVKNEDGSYTFTYVPPTTPSGPSDGDEDEEQPEFPFTDVKTGSWYYNAVKYVYEHGIMAGTGATTFDPNVELTRAMAVQILYNLEGQPTVIGEATFTDTAAAGDWAVEAITWAEQNGIVAGMGDGTFAPKAMVTREQFAQMMYNYAEFKKYDVTKTGNLTQFPDGADVSSWAEIALGWANANGLITGHDDGRLDPQGTAIRAQAASILMNFDRNLAK